VGYGRIEIEMFFVCHDLSPLLIFVSEAGTICNACVFKYILAFLLVLSKSMEIGGAIKLTNGRPVLVLAVMVGPGYLISAFTIKLMALPKINNQLAN
jgi:hypothetical protein